MSNIKKDLEVIDSLIQESMEEVSIKTLKVGDIVCISHQDSTSYEILDIGEPFVLILNLSTNFAALYKGVKFYKKKITKKN